MLCKTYTCNDIQEVQSWFVQPELGTCRWEFFVMSCRWKFFVLSYEFIYILYYAKYGKKNRPFAYIIPCFFIYNICI